MIIFLFYMYFLLIYKIWRAYVHCKESRFCRISCSFKEQEATPELQIETSVPLFRGSQLWKTTQCGCLLSKNNQQANYQSTKLYFLKCINNPARTHFRQESESGSRPLPTSVTPRFALKFCLLLPWKPAPCPPYLWPPLPHVHILLHAVQLTACKL